MGLEVEAEVGEVLRLPWHGFGGTCDAIEKAF